MRVIWWLFYIVLFVVALGFALANPEITELRFFAGDFVWRAPLVVFLLAFFAIGIVVGLMAALPALFRARREAARLNRELKAATKPADPLVVVPTRVPDSAPLGPGTRLGA